MIEMVWERETQTKRTRGAGSQERRRYVETCEGQQRKRKVTARLIMNALSACGGGRENGYEICELQSAKL